MAQAANVYPIPTQFRKEGAPADPAQEPAQAEQAPAALPASDELDISEFLAPEQPQASVDDLAAEAQVSQSAQEPVVQPEPVAQPAPPAIDPVAAQNAQLVAQLQQQVAELQQKAQASQQSAEPPAPMLNLPENMDLTADEQQALGQHVPALQKIVAQTLQGALGPLLERVRSLEERTTSSIADVQQQLGTTTEQAYQSALYAAIPDLNTITSDPRFASFLAKSVPYTGRVVRDVLAEAHAAHDVAAVRNIIDDFRKEYASSAMQQGGGLGTSAQQAAQAAFAQPQTQTAAPVSVAAMTGASASPLGGKRLLASKLAEAADAYSRGRLPAAKWLAIRKLYQDAEAKGQVIYDTPEAM